MRSYRDLFRTPEFTPFFLAASAQTVAQTMGGLALGTLVYRATESPLLSAVSMFGSSLVQVLGARSVLLRNDGARRKAVGLPEARPHVLFGTPPRWTRCRC